MRFIHTRKSAWIIISHTLKLSLAYTRVWKPQGFSHRLSIARAFTKVIFYNTFIYFVCLWHYFPKAHWLVDCGNICCIWTVCFFILLLLLEMECVLFYLIIFTFFGGLLSNVYLVKQSETLMAQISKQINE